MLWETIKGLFIWLLLLLALTGIYFNLTRTKEKINPTPLLKEELLTQEICLLKEEITALRKELKEIESKKKLYSLKVSAYTARKEECDSTPHITAINKRSRPGKTAAVGTDCLDLLGEEIYIKGLGTFHCTDIKPSEGLDLMVGTVKEAKKIGNKTRTVVLIKKG